jgi:CheY-like chemotaxis protein
MSKKVLIIEDNDDIRENVIEILELAGYIVASASNGKAGVELALRDIPDVILCDIIHAIQTPRNHSCAIHFFNSQS